MKTTFYKYQATGNDFVVIDNRDRHFLKSDSKRISDLCHRRFGIGADGLILLEEDPKADFRMVYFNADGHEGSMCGNGGRCAVAFAAFLGMVGESCRFVAADGMHRAEIHGGQISLEMAEVREIRATAKYSFLNTGSPHHVQQVEDLDNLDVFSEGKRIRYGLYGQQGSNVNFVEPRGADRLRVRTYERGVEDETYSCGTGVTASALALFEAGVLTRPVVQVETRGGDLEVRFTPVQPGQYADIWLKGPAEMVFKGEWL
jgi:diaminopimelate epimerase